MPANALGTLSPTVVTLDTIQFLKKTFPMIFSIATDFSKDAVLLNQNVISRVVTPPQVGDFTAPSAGGTGYAANDSATTVDIPVAINKHKFATLSFSDSEIASTNRDLPGEQKQALAYSLGRQLLLDLFALVNPTNFTQTYAITAAANASRFTVSQMRRILVEAGADRNRFGIVNGDVFAGLSEDLGVISKFNFGGADPDYQDGTITGLGGFSRIDEYVELNPANAVLGFFGAKESLLVAARVPEVPDVNIPGRIENVTDPDTGLTLQYREWYDMLGQFNISMTWMYGVAKGVTGHGALLLFSATGNPA